MARVVLVGNLAQVTGGVAEFDLSVTSVRHLFQQLSELHPALEPHLAEGVAVAIDGQIYQDVLFQPIGPNSEVFLLPQIAGGSGGPPPAYKSASVMAVGQNWRSAFIARTAGRSAPAKGQ